MTYQILAGFLLAASGTANAPSQPVWRWETEFGACVLRQDFEDGSGALLVSRTPSSDLTSLSIADNQGQVRNWSEISQAKLKLEPGGSIDADGFLGPGKSKKGRAIGVQVDQSFLGQFSMASAVELSHPKFGSVRTPVRSAAAAVQALLKCEDKKMREWGIDPAALQTLQSRPRPTAPIFKWFSTDDYPRLAAANGVKSEVVALVDVGPDGAVQKCTVINRQLVTLFEDVTCRALKDRARFHPAIGADGKPVSAPFVVRVRFTLG